MKRLFLASFVILGVATVAFADPVKKIAAIDSDKLTKECGEAFIKALMDSKVDDALKLCATPFLDPNGKVSDTLDEVAREFKNGPPAGIEIKVGETIALEKFNEWAKKKSQKELSEEQTKQYGEFLGKDGRIVMLEVKHMGQAPPGDYQPRMLIRIKDGKAQIVGVGGR